MIACIFYKRVLQHSIDDGDTSLPAGAQRHVRNCLACREFYDLERELAQRLVGDARIHRHEPPPFLRGRIMASVDRPFQKAATPKFVHPAWVAAIVVIGLGLVALPLLQRTPHSPSP